MSKPTDRDCEPKCELSKYLLALLRDVFSSPLVVLSKFDLLLCASDDWAVVCA